MRSVTGLCSKFLEYFCKKRGMASLLYIYLYSTVERGLGKERTEGQSHTSVTTEKIPSDSGQSRHNSDINSCKSQKK